MTIDLLTDEYLSACFNWYKVLFLVCHRFLLRGDGGCNEYKLISLEGICHTLDIKNEPTLFL
ncbi:MAG TPA: hypothetical protein DIS98_04165 [Colwellia sp.]|nr:hypothetical protein [Colwellia sp.]